MPLLGRHALTWAFCYAGTILTFNVQNNYNTYRFGGHKVMPLDLCWPCMKLLSEVATAVTKAGDG